MSNARALLLASIELASEEDGAPEWVQLTPAGPEIAARDGRRFRLTRPERIVEAFRALGRDIQIDIEHASQVRATRGLSNPAVGWVTDMEIREGAVWGRVDWTEKGRGWVTGRAYRFLSPAFLHEAGEMTEILSVGLTNEPAFRMAELARAGEEETALIPWTSKAGGDHAWWPLELGEWVVVGAPSGDLAQAVILGSVPTGAHPPHGQPGMYRLSFGEGTFIEVAGGTITIRAAGRVKIDAPAVDINEEE